MTQSPNDSAVEWLRTAIDQALARGVTRSAIHTMVATAPPPRWSYAEDANADWPTDPNRIFYNEAPAGLITLPDAAAKYGIKPGRLNVAVFRGMIPQRRSLAGAGATRRQAPGAGERRASLPGAGPRRPGPMTPGQRRSPGRQMTTCPSTTTCRRA